jgi:hypothetical protein
LLVNGWFRHYGDSLWESVDALVGVLNDRSYFLPRWIYSYTLGHSSIGSWDVLLACLYSNTDIRSYLDRGDSLTCWNSSNAVRRDFLIALEFLEFWLNVQTASLLHCHYTVKVNSAWSYHYAIFVGGVHLFSKD